MSADELEKRYALKVRKGGKETAEGLFQSRVSSQKERLEVWLKPSEIETARGKTRGEIEAIFGTELEDIATVPDAYLKAIFGDRVTDPRVYTSKAYFLDHVVNHHAPDVLPGDYLQIQNIINNPDEVIRDTRVNEKGVRRNGVIFTKLIGKTYLLAINLEERESGKLQLYKSLHRTRNKKPYRKMDRVTLSVDTLSEKSKNPHDAVVSPKGHPAAGDKFSALDKDSSIKDPSRENNGYPQSGGQVRGMYTPAEKMITLFGTADESTFVHESGHYFLDVMMDVVMRSDAPERVRADIQTLMDWFGLKDLEEWNGLSLEEKRQFHEQFARGFEQYLRDGVAPSSRLEAIFKQFKDWLVSIYKSAADLDVELTPEVQDVYARMLATDKEIAAKSEADSPSLFGGDLGQAVSQAVDNTNLPDETKVVIKDGLEAMGMKTEQAPDQSKLSGVMTDDQFVQSRFDLDMEKYGDMPILDENGNETTPREMVAADLAAAEQLEKDSQGMSRAALCMFTNNAFD